MATISKKTKQSQLEQAPEPQEGQQDQEQGIAVEYDEEAGTATVELCDGTSVTLKEPKARAILQMESWQKTAPPEKAGHGFAQVKLAHTCITTFNGKPEKPGFDDFIDMLEVEDLEVLAAALACFPAIQRLNRRAAALQSAG